VSVADIAASAPASAKDLLTRALIAQRKGDVPVAAQLYAELLKLQPDQPDALHFLGVLDFQQGRVAKGVTRIEQAVAARAAPEFLSNLGTVYLAQNRLPEALKVLVRAVEQAPDNASFSCNLGVALTQARDYASAMTLARRVLAKNPGYPAALNVLGNAARLAGEFAASKAAFTELLAQLPNDPDTHYNLGVVQQDLWDMTGARASYERAIALKEDVARYHVNLGAALMKLHEIARAGRSYARALELEPQLAEAHYNLAICQFLQGNLSEGAQHYDWRLKIDETSLSKPRDMQVPLWDGAPAPGKTILLHSEQGLGDMLQFIRLAPAVAAMVGKVVVEVQKPIRQLLQDAFPDLTIIAKGDTPPPFELHCPLMSLMLALKLEQDDLPASLFPYLRARPERIDKWRQRLSGKPGKLIAIAWQGNPKAKVDRGRSMPLTTLAPLLGIPGLRFISLQKNDGAEQLAALPPALRAKIETLGDDFDAGPDGFLDSAAVMACCDLVLTTDTALAHLAGALSRPTWLMLKRTPDWRWLCDRTDSPWYPSMRLFRQREDGNWSPVIAAIAQELQPARAELVAAITAHHAGQLDVAEAAYRKVLTAQPDEPVARHHLGVVALQRGQHDVAETHIRAALELRPDDPDALANLALALKGQGRLEEAVATCRHVLALTPAHSAAHNNLANLLKQQGRPAEAIPHYRQAIALAPGKADLLHNLGL
jgi:tetratricopeptide (TPR) repeat protein